MRVVPAGKWEWARAAESARLVAMENSARNIVLVPPPDGRQSETALAVARGTARLLRYLQRIGLSLKAGDQISVTGWAKTRHAKTTVLARELTFGEKTYTLRNDHRKLIRLAPAPKPQQKGTGKEKTPEK